VVGPSLLAVAVWSIATLAPAALSSAGERLIDAEEEQAVLVAELAAARSVPADADDTGRRITAAAIAVPETLELASFIRQVGQVGDSSQVSIEQIAPLSVASDSDADALIQLPSGTSSVSVSIGASGTYEQVMAFATGLRQLDRLVVVDLVGLTADSEDAGRVIMDLELRIFTTDVLVITPQFDEEELLDASELDTEAAGEGSAP
jgi:Tfp pilus assembly protein PilO